MMAMPNAFDPAHSAGLSERDAALIARRERAIGPAYRLFYETPLHFVRGDGVWLYDEQGRRYLDAYNNVCSIGHCHPRVVEAVSAQMATLNTHTRYLHEAVVLYAERLLATMPGPEARHVMFTCSGSEANDLALRIARNYTGRQGVIVTRNAYHGVTEATAEISPSLGALGPGSPRVRFIPGPGGPDIAAEEHGRKLEESLAAAVADLRRSGLEPAAFVVDTVLSSEGLFPYPAGFLKPAVDLIRREGGLFIADEVQAGFARTGEKFWGFQRHGLAPDIVSMGKPMGNGFPVAGIIVRAELLREFGAKTRYFNTYGGSPVASAAGLAVLDVIRDEGLQENALETGTFLREGLQEIVAGRDDIGEVRGVGMFLAADCVRKDDHRMPDPGLAARVVNELCRRGILISAIGPGANVLKIRPPLVMGKGHAVQFLDALRAVFSDLGAGRS